MSSQTISSRTIRPIYVPVFRMFFSPFRFPLQNSVHISLLPHAYVMPRASPNSYQDTSMKMATRQQSAEADKIDQQIPHQINETLTLR